MERRGVVRSAIRSSFLDHGRGTHKKPKFIIKRSLTRNNFNVCGLDAESNGMVEMDGLNHGHKHQHQSIYKELNLLKGVFFFISPLSPFLLAQSVFERENPFLFRNQILFVLRIKEEMSSLPGRCQAVGRTILYLGGHLLFISFVLTRYRKLPSKIEECLLWVDTCERKRMGQSFQVPKGNLFLLIF